MNNGKLRAVLSNIFLNILISIGIMCLTTLLALLLHSLNFSESDIIMIYILGVLVVARRTDGYLGGICAAVLGVLSFNFFFTVPLYTLMAYSSEYPITFIVMLIVALITSTLTTRVRREAKRSQLREQRANTLYNISRNLLTTRSIDQIISTAAVNIADLCGNNVAFYTVVNGSNLSEPYVYSLNENMTTKFLTNDIQRETAYRAYSEMTVIDGDIYYLPVSGRSRTLGVLGVDNRDNSLTDDQKALLNALVIQIALSMEREISSSKQHQTKMEIESERLRSNLLRAVSHDLRTPLTGIVGSTSALLDDWEIIDDNNKKSLLSGVYEDAVWLSRSVNNILDITRMEDGRVQIKKSAEAVEEIIGEAVAIVQKHAGNHTISIDIPDNVMMVNVDGNLMKQLLVNLMENAVKYTPEGSSVRVAAYYEGDSIVFEVADNGKGIEENDLPYIFDRFYTTDKASGSSRKGIGLGLAICKSIALAHKGTIMASNQETGGAIFKVTLPQGE